MLVKSLRRCATALGLSTTLNVMEYAPALIEIYKTLVRPCFDYSCVVYHSLLTKNLSEKLEKQQRIILKMIYGFDVSYSTH